MTTTPVFVTFEVGVDDAARFAVKDVIEIQFGKITSRCRITRIDPVTKHRRRIVAYEFIRWNDTNVTHRPPARSPLDSSPDS